MMGRVMMRKAENVLKKMSAGNLPKVILIL